MSWVRFDLPLIPNVRGRPATSGRTIHDRLLLHFMIINIRTITNFRTKVCVCDPVAPQYFLINDNLVPISCLTLEGLHKNNSLTELQSVDTQYDMRNFFFGKDGGHGTMSMSMVIIAGLGRLPLVLRASNTCGEYAGPLPAEFFPSVGIGTSSNRRYGAFNPSRLSAWPAPLRTICSMQNSVVIPSWPSTVSDAAALSGPGQHCRAPRSPDVWPVSHSSKRCPLTHHSLSPLSKRRVRDRCRAVPSGQLTREEETRDVR